MEKPSEPSSPISALYCASEFPHPDEDAFSDNKSPVSSEFPKSSCPQPTTTPLEPPPDGGLLAWTQVFCAFLVFVNTWGFVNSFGAFQAYYTSILPQAPSTISWIGSVQTCLMFFLGTFSGRALDAGYFHFTVIVGIVVQCVGIFTMSLARNYWQLLLTHGFATGVGGGIFFTPVMGLVSTYFARKRGMALGIVTCGNSAGGIIYPLVIRQLLPQIGFAWTVRVLGFINVVCLGVVIAFMKPRLAPRKAGPLIDMDAFHDLPYVLWALAICFLMAPMYLVFYYVINLYSYIFSQLADMYLDCNFRKRHNRPRLHRLTKPRHRPQRHRHSRSNSSRLHCRHLLWGSQHLHVLCSDQHCRFLFLACHQNYCSVLRLLCDIWSFIRCLPIAFCTDPHCTGR